MSFGQRGRFSDIGLPREPSATRRRSAAYANRPDEGNSYDHLYGTAGIRSPSSSGRVTRRRESSGVYVSPAFEEMLNAPPPINNAYPIGSPSRVRPPPAQPMQRLQPPAPENPRTGTPSRIRATPASKPINRLIFRAFVGIAALLLTLLIIYALFFRQPVHHVQHHRLYAGYKQQSQTVPVPTAPASSAAPQEPSVTSSSAASKDAVQPSTLAQPSFIDSGDLASYTIRKYHAYTQPTAKAPVPQKSWWSTIFTSSKADSATEVRALPTPPPTTPSPVFSNPEFMNTCSGKIRSLSPIARSVADAIMLNGTGIINGVCAPQIIKNTVDITLTSSSPAAPNTSNTAVTDVSGKGSSVTGKGADVTPVTMDFWEEIMGFWSGEGVSDSQTSFDKHTHVRVDGHDAVVVDVNSDDLDLIDDVRARAILSTLTTPLNAEELRGKWANISYIFDHFGKTLGDEQHALQMRRDADNSLLLLAQTIVREREEREKVVLEGSNNVNALLSSVSDVEAVTNERVEWVKSIAEEGKSVSQRQDDVARLRGELKQAQEKQSKISRELATAKEREAQATHHRAQCDADKKTEAIATKVSQLEEEIAAVKASATTLEQEARIHAEAIVLLRRSEKDKRKEVGKRRAALRRLRGAGTVDGGDDDDQLYLTLASELGRVDGAIAKLLSADGKNEEGKNYGDSENVDKEDSFEWDSEDEDISCQSPSGNSESEENSRPECELAQRLERLRTRRIERLNSRRAQLERVLRELEGEKATLKGEEVEEEAVKTELARLRSSLATSIQDWEKVRQERENMEKIRAEISVRERERGQDEVDLKSALMKLMRHRAELAHAHEACVYKADGELNEARAKLQQVAAEAGTVGSLVEKLMYELDVLMLGETERQARKEAREKELRDKESNGMQSLCTSLVNAATGVGACEMENEKLHRRIEEWFKKRVVQKEKITLWEREKSKITVVRRAIARTMA